MKIQSLAILATLLHNNFYNVLAEEIVQPVVTAELLEDTFPETYIDTIDNENEDVHNGFVAVEIPDTIPLPTEDETEDVSEERMNPNTAALYEILDALKEKIEKLDAIYYKEKEAEKAFNWEGWSESMDWCKDGVCPENSECKLAKYVSTSGHKCRCKPGYELTYDSVNKKTCSNYAGWIDYNEFCVKDKCPKNSFCRMTLTQKKLCSCFPEFKMDLKRKKYSCDA